MSIAAFVMIQAYAIARYSQGVQKCEVLPFVLQA